MTARVDPLQYAIAVELGKDFARIADGARIAVIMGMHTG